MSEYCVYVHQNKRNLKVYVGYSEDVVHRWWLTNYNANWALFYGYNDPFYNAIRRDGWNSFTHTIIEVFDNKQDALDAEIFWIAFFRSNRKRYGIEYGYNLTDGGECGPDCTGMKRTPETCQNISNALRKHYAEHESKRKGISLTEEHKANVSKGSIGKSGTNTGRKFSEEHKKRIGISNASTTPEQEDIICYLYNLGATSIWLANQYNIDRAIIPYILRRNNQIVRAVAYNFVGPLTVEDKDRICYLYNLGGSTNWLAKKFDTSGTNIRRIIRNNDHLIRK